MSGYTIRSALRHLAIGLRRPRQATREAIGSGLGEIQRIRLATLVTGSVALTSEPTWDAFDSQVDGVDQSERYVTIPAWIVALPLAAIVHYLIGSALAALASSTFRNPGWIFSDVRSAWTLANWIANVPIVVWRVGEPLLPTALSEAAADAPVGPPFVVSATYGAFCLAEFSGVSLPQAFVAASFSCPGLYFLAILVDRASLVFSLS